MTSPLKYFKQVREELSKVTWPKRPEVIRGTVTVVVVSVVTAIILGAVDLGLTKGLESLLAAIGK